MQGVGADAMDPVLCVCVCVYVRACVQHVCLCARACAQNGRRATFARMQPHLHGLCLARVAECNGTVWHLWQGRACVDTCNGM